MSNPLGGSQEPRPEGERLRKAHSCCLPPGGRLRSQHYVAGRFRGVLGHRTGNVQRAYPRAGLLGFSVMYAPVVPGALASAWRSRKDIRSAQSTQSAAKDALSLFVFFGPKTAAPARSAGLTRRLSAELS